MRLSRKYLDFAFIKKEIK